MVAGSEAEEDEAEMDEKDWNAQTLSIRRADGEEVLTIVAHGEEWSTIHAARRRDAERVLGHTRRPDVWVDAAGRQIERDEDGTYFVRLD